MKPRYATREAACADLVIREPLPVTIMPGTTAKLATGLVGGEDVRIPEGYMGDIRPRSSAFLRGLVVMGSIDPDYRGEIYVMVLNASSALQRIYPGEAVAQLAIVPVVRDTSFVVVGRERGEGGFGSTGR